MGIKRVLSQLHRYVLWALLSVVFWAWIFTLRLDAPRKEKLTVYTDVDAVSVERLSEALSALRPDGIRLVRVHPFSYAAFDTNAPNEADLYLLTESALSAHTNRLLPLFPEQGGKGEGPLAYGACVYDADSRTGMLKEYFKDAAAAPTESCYLCLNRDSWHLGARDGAGDDAAIVLMRRILTLP